MCRSRVWRWTCVAVLALMSFFSRPGVGEDSVVVADEDAWIHGLSSGVNAGSDNQVCICPLANYWVYLKFNLPDLAGRIESAELRLTRFDGDRPEEISLYLVDDDTWSEAELTGPERPAPRDPDLSSALGTGAAATGYDRWSSDALTAVARLEAAGDGVLSLMLREDPDDVLDVRHYYSREGALVSDEAPRLVLTLREPERVALGWEVFDISEGTKPALDFGPDDTFHVMAMTEVEGGVVWYATSESPAGPWAPREVATGYFYGPGDIRVGGDGTAHLAWHNHDSQNPDHVAVSLDGELARSIIETEGHDGWDNTLSFDPQGRLHQASIYPVAFGTETSLQHGVLDGGEWTYETVSTSLPTMYGLATSIAVDSSANPHIAFCMAEDWTAPGALVYAVRRGGIWSFEPVVEDGPRGRFPSLALDHWDRPHLSWLDIDPSDDTRATVHYAVRNNDAWEIETIDELDAVKLGHPDARRSTSLVLDNNSRPHLAYGDTAVVRHSRKPFGAWETVTVLDNRGAATYKGLVVLRLDSGEEPAVVFWEDVGGGRGLVRLATTIAACPTPGACEGAVGPFVRGECTGDDEVDLSDAVCVLQWLYVSGEEPGCVAAADANGDEAVDLSDPVWLLSFLYVGGPPPAVPYPDCETSSLDSDMDLGCEAPPACPDP